MANQGQDAKFFQRGKIQEFRAELQAAESKDKKCRAMSQHTTPGDQEDGVPFLGLLRSCEG